MNELDFTYYGPYNSKEPFSLDYIKRYTNDKRFSKTRSDEVDIPETSEYHLIFSSTENTIVKNGDAVYDIPENSFLIYTPHGTQTYTQPPNSSFVICIFSGTHIQSVLTSLNLDCNTVYTLSRQYVSIDESMYFNKQLESICDEHKTKKPYYNQRISGMFHIFLTDCARNIKSSNGNNTITQVQKVVKYIKDNVARPLDIDHLVEMSYLSRSRFYHVFKEHTGSSPIEFQNKCRLNIAKDYLTFYPEYSISSVASTLGFNDSLYFSKLFKKEYGISPSQYRKELNNKKK